MPETVEAIRQNCRELIRLARPDVPSPNVEFLAERFTYAATEKLAKGLKHSGFEFAYAQFERELKLISWEYRQLYRGQKN